MQQISWCFRNFPPTTTAVSITVMLNIRWRTSIYNGWEIYLKWNCHRKKAHVCFRNGTQFFGLTHVYTKNYCTKWSFSDSQHTNSATKKYHNELLLNVHIKFCAFRWTFNEINATISWNRRRTCLKRNWQFFF